MTFMQTTISKLAKYQPRNNLPLETSSKRRESNLLLSFLRWYVDSLESNVSTRNYFFIREIDLNGFGIADLLLFETSTAKSSNVNDSNTGYVTTFEIKIRDWRKAIKQSIRYRYYSNRVIVVLPKENINPAIKHLEMFKQLEIGLWSFDKQSSELFKYFTPRYRKPLDYKAKQKVISLFAKKIKAP